MMEKSVTAATTPLQGPPPEAMGFTGRPGEYFRVWIVNLCLTVITVGIYSPWAKVRRTKYLYRHSQLAGASFDYHADPVAILRGRLIALAMFAIYLFTTVTSPALSLLCGLAIGLVVPWLLVRSRMFAMRNSSYRNVRFRFRPVYKQAYRVMIGRFLLVLVSLGLYYPVFRYHRSRLIVDNTAWGTLDLELSDEIGGADFYSIYLAAGLLFAFIGFAVGLPLSIMKVGGGDASGAATTAAWLAFAPTIVLGLLYLLVYFGVDMAITRLIVRNTAVGEHQLRCDWRLAKLLWIQATNLLAILLSVGLLIPWATIRLHGYKLSALAVVVQGDLAAVAAAEAEEVSALGEEIGETFDFDFGL